MKTDLIRTVQLVWEKSEVKRVNHVQLLLPAGEAMTLLGVEGSGKKSLSSLLAGLETPTSGQILYRETPAFPQKLQAIAAFIRRGQGLLPTLSVAENLALAIPNQTGVGVPLREYAQIKRLLEQYALAQWLSTPVREIPLLVQKQILMLRATLQGKELIIFAGGGKTEEEASLQPLLFTIQKLTQSGISVLYTTDRMDYIAQNIGNTLILRHGTTGKRLRGGVYDEQDLAEWLYTQPSIFVSNWEQNQQAEQFLLQDRWFTVYGGSVVRICNTENTNDALFSYLASLCVIWRLPAPVVMGTEQVNYGWIANMSVMENLLLSAAPRVSSALGYVSARKRRLLASEAELAVGVHADVWQKYPHQLVRADKLRLQMFRYRLQGVRIIIANCNEFSEEDQSTLLSCAEGILDYHCALLCVAAGMRAQEYIWQHGMMQREGSA